ncbi:hypothetical protein DF186_21690, partial [Enterococcus hirae]
TQTARVHELAQRLDATPYMVLLSAFQVLLSRWLGGGGDSRDLLVGTPIPGRPQPELEALLGRFGDLLLVRAELTPELSFDAL